MSERDRTEEAEALRVQEDEEWLLDHPELAKQYGGRFIAVHNQRVWGHGKSRIEAVTVARQQKGCPQPLELLLLEVPETPTLRLNRLWTRNIRSTQLVENLNGFPIND